MHDLLAYLIKHVPLIQWLYKNTMSALFRIWGICVHTDDKLVLLSSMSGDAYGGSPRAIFESMKRDSRFSGYQYIWAFSEPEKYEIDGASTVRIDSFQYFRTALKAKIWITDVNIERGLHFKKINQIYLNTWHGTGPKKGGNAVKGRKDYDFSYVDIVCVDGQYARNEMVNFFNAKDENLLWCGRPREDELFELTEADRIRIRHNLNIPDNKKVILYMPTWREYGLKPIEVKLWEGKLENEFMVLVRAHHFTKEAICEQQKMWLDVTNYPSVNELYWIADVLISDYSSAFFDFGLLGRPMLCYAYDYEQYEAANGLLMDLKGEFPGGILRDENELLSRILTMDYETLSKECSRYCRGYVCHPGNATSSCVNRIYDLVTK